MPTPETQQQQQRLSTGGTPQPCATEFYNGEMQEKMKFQVLPKPLNARPNPGNPKAILLAI